MISFGVLCQLLLPMFLQKKKKNSPFDYLLVKKKKRKEKVNYFVSYCKSYGYYCRKTIINMTLRSL